MISGPSIAPPALNAVFTVSAMGTPQLLIPSKCPNQLVSVASPSLTHFPVIVGQNPYQSRVSGREEFAPIFTTIVGGPHTDLTLLAVAQGTLDSAGWPSTVLTGRYMFQVGNNERHSTAGRHDPKL